MQYFRHKQNKNSQKLQKGIFVPASSHPLANKHS